MPNSKFRDPKYLKAISHRHAIEKAGLKPGDLVTIGGEQYTFKKIVTGGRLSVKPLSGGRGVVVNLFSVTVNGKPIAQ